MQSRFEWVGGNLSLNFNNTVAWLSGEPPAHNRIGSYRDLLYWARQAGLISSDAHRKLNAEARRRPRAAARVLQRAYAVRSTIHGVFSAVARGNEPDEEQIESLNELLSRVPLRLRFTAQTQGFGWDWSGAGTDLSQVLWPIIWSAASLLNSDQLSHVRQCEAERCGWLFVDRSRRGNRKWCDMRDCGNRAKARRHYERQRRSTKRTRDRGRW